MRYRKIEKFIPRWRIEWTYYFIDANWAGCQRVVRRRAGGQRAGRLVADAKNSPVDRDVLVDEGVAEHFNEVWR